MGACGRFRCTKLNLVFWERTLFAGVSFSIKEREKVGFVGANGVGKTSLFKVICGDYTPDSGGAFLSKNCKLGYMEQHTCSAGNTVWNELVSVFAPLMELERQLEEVGDRLRSERGYSGGYCPARPFDGAVPARGRPDL